MSKDIDKYKVEESRTVEKTRVEEFLNIDESLIELEKNSNIVRLDMNTLEFPLFSKDTRRKSNQIKKYYFKADGSSYLEVEPGADLSIPGDFEERVFIALTKIMRNNGYGRKFIVTANEIMNNLNLKYTGAYVKKLRKAIKTLTKTRYTFKNSLYSNDKSSVINDEIGTAIMNIRIISRKDKESDEIEQFEDGRTKEVYEISLSDYFYTNIVKKGYLTFDSEKLLKMKAITRSIYQMIEKWRGYKLYLKRPALYIARRIPLKWDKRVIGRTIETIEKSCIELKKIGLIKGYKIIKNKKWELAEIEFTFDEKHNKIKRDSFFEDKRFTDGLGLYITHTEHKEIDNNKNIEEAEIISSVKDKFTDDELKKIKEALPERAQKLKTIDRVIKEYSKKYDFSYLLSCAEYTALNAKSSYRAYFISVIENNYAEEYILKQKEKQEKQLILEKKEKNKQAKIEEIYQEAENTDKKYREIFEKYLSYDEITRLEIEAKVLEKFKKDSKFRDEKTLLKVFNSTKKGLISTFLLENLSIHAKKKILIKKSKNLETLKKMEITNEKEESIEKKGNYLYNIEDSFESITSFSMKVIKILREIEIEEYKDVLEVLKMFEEFKDTIKGYKIQIKFNEEDLSYIKVQKL